MLTALASAPVTHFESALYRKGRNRLGSSDIVRRFHRRDITDPEVCRYTAIQAAALGWRCEPHGSRTICVSSAPLRASIAMPMAWLPQGVLVAVLALFHLVGPLPADLGVHNGRLAPCPSPAHCARVDWPVADPQAAVSALVPVIEATPRIVVVEQAHGYLHATATSAFFGFVDDLELYADAAHGVLQARSVSRLGDSDLGVNSRRLEMLRQALPG